jgi:hypothetical protein
MIWPILYFNFWMGVTAIWFVRICCDRRNDY